MSGSKGGYFALPGGDDKNPHPYIREMGSPIGSSYRDSSDSSSSSDRLSQHRYDSHGSMSNPNSAPNSPSSSFRRPGNRQRDVDTAIPRFLSQKTPSLFNTLKYRNASTRELNRYRLAAKYVYDAEHGVRPILSLKHGALFDWVAYLTRSAYFQWFMGTIMVAHCLLILFEANPKPSPHYDDPVTIIEYVFLSCYVFDISLSYIDLGTYRFLREKSVLVYALMVLVMITVLVVDIVWDTNAGVYVRALRPLLILTKFPSLRTLAVTMLLVIPKIVHTLVLALILLSAYSVIGVALFHGIYPDPLQNFDNFPNAFLAMSVLLTTENFPYIMYPSLAANKDIEAAFFFGTFVMLGVWVYMSLLLAVMYEYYMHCHEDEVLYSRVREQQALLLAFSVLNEEDDVLDYDTFYGLMREVRPHITEDLVRVAFKCLDADMNHNIDAEEFLKLCEVLRYKVTRKVILVPGKRQLSPMTRFWHYLCTPKAHWARYVDSRAFDWFIKLIFLINFVALSLWRDGMSEDTATYIDITNRVCLGFFTVEMFCRIMAMGLTQYVAIRWFDLLLVVLSIPSEIIFPDSISTRSSKVSILQIFRSIRIFHMVTLWPQLRTNLKAVMLGYATLGRLIALLGIVFYVYAVIGMQLFSGKWHTPDAPIQPQPPSKGPSVHEIVFEDFDSWWHAILSLFQISTTNNWNEVMYSVIDNVYASLYFVSFFFFVCMLALNIITALIIDSYTMYMSGTKPDDYDVIYLTSSPCSSPPGSPRPGLIRKYSHGIEAELKAKAKNVNASLAGKEDSVSRSKSLEQMPYAPAHATRPEEDQTIALENCNLYEIDYKKMCDMYRRGLPEYHHKIYRVEKVTDWLRSLVADRIPELKHKEVESLRTKIEKLQSKLDVLISTNPMDVKHPHMTEKDVKVRSELLAEITQRRRLPN